MGWQNRNPKPDVGGPWRGLKYFWTQYKCPKMDVMQALLAIDGLQRLGLHETVVLH